MATFKYISSRGDELPLSDAQNFKLVNIDAQTSAATSISSVVIGNTDGDTVNNVQTVPRTIILDLRIIDEVEITKREILNIIKLKQKGRIVWSQNGNDLEIEGIVEAIEMPRWNNAVMMQITIHCSQPYWENVEFIVSQISEAINLHYFTDFPEDQLCFPEAGIPFGQYETTRSKTFYNAGDVAVGMQIEISALATVTNPIITNNRGEFFGCGYGTGNRQVVMSAGDIIIINTGKNKKSVTLNGQSILTKIKPRSTWLQIDTGDNAFQINSDDESIENMTFSLIYKERYI